MVLAHPRGVEPERLGTPDHLQGVAVLLREGPRRLRRELSGEQPDPDANGHDAEAYPEPRRRRAYAANASATITSAPTTRSHARGNPPDDDVGPGVPVTIAS